MKLTINAKNGQVEIRTQQRADHRWASEFRYVPKGGAPSDWTPACSPEGFVTDGMALSAAILLGKQTAEDMAAERAGAT